MEAILVYSTFPSESEASDLAEKLIKQKLIACANIIPSMTSVYQWKGKMQTEKEAVFIGKTTKARYEEVQKFIQDHHSYECPCVLQIKIEDGSTPFFQWIEEQIK